LFHQFCKMIKATIALAFIACQTLFCPSYGQQASLSKKTSLPQKAFPPKKAFPPDVGRIRSGFLQPPSSARPGVYWYFMDGNRSKEAMRKDLESMKQAGIGNLIFLEVNIGIPRGPVDLLSKQWLDMYAYAVKEAERLGIEITMGIGPGWTGSGGPWVRPSEAMQDLVGSAIQVSGGGEQKIVLPVPEPKPPYFGMDQFTPALKKQWEGFYKDVAVLAFPTPSAPGQVPDIGEKALYYRAPVSSVKGVKSLLPSLAAYPALPANAVIPKDEVIDLTDKLQPDGTLNWTPPAGNYTIMRFVSRNNGALTRPAPLPGLGFESDKFDTVALNAHLEAYIGKLLTSIGHPVTMSPGGLKRLHMDSWEMGAQNWTGHFREEFRKRRGYDPLPFYPVYAGKVIQSLEISERFLWDLRLTAQELVLDYHAGQVRRYSHRHGLGLSIEPYDMNPTADLDLGAVADVPMAEFWSKGYGYNTAFSVIEATSVAHVNGKSLVPAESFTAVGEDWRQYPGSMKNQGDWAFASGINRFVFHTFQHQSLPDSLRPGMTMGAIGVHWDRGETWWPMVRDYHRYISRCSFVLQQGRAIADILYLTPEGAPQVFRPPLSALAGDSVLPDRKGYNFDGCSPGELYSASVKDHRVVFASGASYRVLILPASETMTPALLAKVLSLVREGAIVVGNPPVKSPGLSGYPECDREVQSMAAELWGRTEDTAGLLGHSFGKGRIIRETKEKTIGEGEAALYPDYDQTAALLVKMDVRQDFESAAPIRYTHRAGQDWDIYFVSNRTDAPVKGDAIFRSDKGTPEIWDAVTGETRRLPEFTRSNGRTAVPLVFDRYQSFFVVFKGPSERAAPAFGPAAAATGNFPAGRTLATLEGPWAVTFDPHWGGPGKTVFERLEDWTESPVQGIRYYSGIARYQRNFDLPFTQAKDKNKRVFIDLGTVKDMARIRLNGKDLGVVWTAPHKVDITDAVKQKDNLLVIEVVNRWPNRLIGDEQFPDDGIRDGQWPEWLVKGQPRPGKRYTFTTYHPYGKDSPLLPSGLLGPVTIVVK
jgi:hypothetical protein